MTIIIIYIYFLLRFRFLFGYERFYIASHAQIYSARFAANQIVYNTFIFYYLFIRFVSGFAGSNRLLERAMQRNKKSETHTMISLIFGCFALQFHGFFCDLDGGLSVL